MTWAVTTPAAAPVALTLTLMSDSSVGVMNETDNDRWLQFGLVLGAFTLGTSENVIAGILTDIAQHFGVSLASAGLLVTVYALTVTLLGPLVTVMVARFNPVRSVLALCIVYLLASVAAASATSFALIAASRVVAALCHTTLLVLLVLTAMTLAAPGWEGRAVARVSGGLAIAAVLGVPIGVVAAQAAGWRAAFAVVVVLASATVMVLARRYPRHIAMTVSRDLGSLFRVLRRRTVLVCVTASALGATSALTVSTYVVVLLTRTAGLSTSVVAPVLLAYGVGGVIGNTLGGRLADTLRTKAVPLTFGLLTASLVLLWACAARGWLAVPALVLVGISYFATFTPLNTAVARDTADIAPDAALALNSSAFNLGIAAAGVLGGSLVALSADGAWLAPASAGVSLLGMAVAIAGLRTPSRGGGLGDG